MYKDILCVQVLKFYFIMLYHKGEHFSINFQLHQTHNIQLHAQLDKF